MATGSTQLASHTRMEDVLEHLPIAGISEFETGQTLYSSANPSRSLYLVISGKVLISRIAGDGSEVVLDIIKRDELFGEAAFLDLEHRPEEAVALDKVTVMSWAIAGVEEMIAKRPRLALALLQALTQRNVEFSRRIEGFSLDNIERRLAAALIRFTDRLGQCENDGSVTLMPLTHELLARYVGTSREIVTQYMNRFRKAGYVSYSRHGIVMVGDRLQLAMEASSGSAGKEKIRTPVRNTGVYTRVTDGRFGRVSAAGSQPNAVD